MGLALSFYRGAFMERYGLSVILDAFQEDMRKSGASYPEMFKKVKNELARKYKAVL